MSILVKHDSVVIGNQEWALFNFDDTKFRNGDPIVQAQSDEEWEAYNEKMLPAWCFNPEKSQGTGAFGKLYNWYAVSDPRGIAPDGWHVPDFNEWLSLLKYLGPGPRQGIKLKSARLWDGNNESGFDALPAGIRSGPPDVDSWEYCGSSIEEFAAWWLIDESQDENKSTALFLTDQEPEPLFFLEFKNQGFSLRLIKNSKVF